MRLKDLLTEKKISCYRLSKMSGVPQTTVIDICSGKSRIEKCSAETLYKIAKALQISMESLLEESPSPSTPTRLSFEVFKSNVCHFVKDKGDISFILDILEENEIQRLYDRKWYPEAFYLLAMVDYLSRENNVPLCSHYDDIRRQKLPEPLYPTGAVLADTAMNSDRQREKALQDAIPEFKQFNIIESEVRNVC